MMFWRMGGVGTIRKHGMELLLIGGNKISEMKKRDEKHWIYLGIGVTFEEQNVSNNKENTEGCKTNVYIR